MAANSDVLIYHNPNCGTSRNVLALIREAGIEPTVIKYLETPPDKNTIKALLKAMNMTVRDLLRQKGTPYDELDLGDDKWTDEQLLDQINAHPILMNRPIVVTLKETKLCRPSEAVLPLLAAL